MSRSEAIEELIDFKFLLECLKKEIEDLQGMNEFEISREALSRKIQKSKALAYLVSVALQVLERVRLEEEIKELREIVEELRQ